jgi:hypothetical protein
MIPIKEPRSGWWKVYVDLSPLFEVIFLACVLPTVEVRLDVLSSVLCLLMNFESATGLIVVLSARVWYKGVCTAGAKGGSVRRTFDVECGEGARARYPI